MISKISWFALINRIRGIIYSELLWYGFKWSKNARLILLNSYRDYLWLVAFDYIISAVECIYVECWVQDLCVGKVKHIPQFHFLFPQQSMQRMVTGSEDYPVLDTATLERPHSRADWFGFGHHSHFDFSEGLSEVSPRLPYCLI